MAFQNVTVLQHADAQFESPAKVFARLKSKVQREAKGDMFIDAKPPREKHEADLNSPRTRTCSARMHSELKENQKFDSYHSEAEALTISPTSSPQKSIGYSYPDFGCNPDVEMPPLNDIGHTLQARNQHTPSKRTPLVNGFTGISRTPVKNSCAGWLSGESCAPLEKMMSPSKRFSLMKNSLGKREWGQQETDKASISTKEVCSGGMRQLEESRRWAAFREDDTSHICTEDLGSEPSEITQITQERMLAQPRSVAQTWCNGNLGKPLMSPAKMFAYMMERENRRVQHEVHKVSSSTREVEDAGHYSQVSNTPPSTADNTGETLDTASRGSLESVSPDIRSRLEPADRQSNMEPSDVPPPAVPSQPVLLEDPLVLNSPRICIPKKNKAVFKQNKWSQDAPFPSESVLYLTKWFLRRNCKGMFIDGLLKECKTPWNSNIIVERVSNSVLKTVSGRVYVLVGKMMVIANSEFPNWLLKKFAHGFPPNWKELYEKFLSESKDNSRRDTKRNREKRRTPPKQMPKCSASNRTVKQHRQKPLETPDSCVPASASSTKLSRSGRVIKAPLEYWKGGRVMLDAHMNVTIYECYDTSICQPKVTTTVCANSQKLAQVPSSEGRTRYESSSNSEPSVPQRRVKAPLRKCNRFKVKPDEQPPPPAQPLVEMLSHHISSPEERSRNLRRCPAPKRTQVNTVLPPQRKPEKPATQKSSKQTHKTSRSSASSSAEHRAFRGKASRHQQSSTSEEEFTDKRKKRGKGAHRNVNRSRPNRKSPSNQSEESVTELRRSSRVTRPKTSPPVKSTQTHKKHKGHKKMILQEQNEDEWTEAELLKLQQAVSCYPKYMAGYWAKVAMMVGTRSAEECHNQHTSQGKSQTPAKKTKKEKVEAPKESAPECPLISAGVGTFKRKQQVRQFLEAMPRDNVEDIFSTAAMQSRRFEIPSICESEDHDGALSDLEPVTPMTTRLHEAKTPQCLHITPGMMGSPNRHNDDKYVYQLQRRMKKNQFNVHKQAASSKGFTPSPAAKRKMRKCSNTENDSFVVWEMFPDQEPPESGEEEDFYFSDDD